jgi:hypothetical protein
LDYLLSAVNELLRRVGGVVPQEPAPVVAAPLQAVTPDDLPDPVPGEGLVSYAMRCADFVGGEKGAQAKRAAGSLFIAGQTLVNKHGGIWKAAVWEFIHGDPNYRADSRWADYRPGR